MIQYLNWKVVIKNNNKKEEKINRRLIMKRFYLRNKIN